MDTNQEKEKDKISTCEVRCLGRVRKNVTRKDKVRHDNIRQMVGTTPSLQNIPKNKELNGFDHLMRMTNIRGLSTKELQNNVPVYKIPDYCSVFFLAEMKVFRYESGSVKVGCLIITAHQKFKLSYLYYRMN